ncbi:sensor histidine kinase [Kitasatospora sp. NPDC059795]|uniref:sensor histidine kinase n=1 Tax=Kitasatospora sp. NPDC059795 TaxID=3346949 RepID=UPI00365AB929
MNLTRVPPKVLSRVAPGTWMVLLWLAVTAYTVFEQSHTRDGISVLTLSTGNQIDEVIAVLAVIAAGRRRRRPLTALCLLLLGTVASVMAMAVADIPLLQYLVVDVAICYLAATRPTRTSVAAGALALGTLLGYSGLRALSGMDDYGSTTLTAALTTAIAWLIGHAVHQSHTHAETLRTQATEQAITTERLRIARELHDMVAHNISIVAMQAGAARRVFDTQPERARAALGEVETAGRETLAGLRRLLGALRDADTPDAAEQVAPAPGLDDLDRLAATTAAAGVRVAVHRSGERRALPPEIELSAYRIVQEAVTNVVRHAKVRACRVVIEYGSAELAVSVVNAGGGGGSSGSGGGPGYGLVGMRERTVLLHGEFTAGPTPDGGFRVVARLPLPVTAREDLLPSLELTR